MVIPSRTLVTNPGTRIVASELRGRDTGSATEVATAAAQVWEKLANHFARIIGEAGIRILLVRSVMAARARFPWLESAAASDAGMGPALRATLAQRDAGEAARALADLLTTVIGLIGRFIGDALVEQLLQEVWPEVFLYDDRETT